MVREDLRTLRRMAYEYVWDRDAAPYPGLAGRSELLRQRS